MQARRSYSFHTYCSNEDNNSNNEEIDEHFFP